MTVRLLTNIGHGEFSGPTDFAIDNGSGAGHVTAADLDKDGDQDLAVALQNSASIRVMINTGGVFTNGSTTAVGEWLRTARKNLAELRGLTERLNAVPVPEPLPVTRPSKRLVGVRVLPCDSNVILLDCGDRLLRSEDRVEARMPL